MHFTFSINRSKYKHPVHRKMPWVLGIWFYKQSQLFMVIRPKIVKFILKVFLLHILLVRYWDDARRHPADRNKTFLQLEPPHLISHSPPSHRRLFFRGRITSQLASSPSITPAHSACRRGNSVLFCVSAPPSDPARGPERIPVISSSKLRYARTLTHMKERERREAASQSEEGESLTRRDLKCQVSVGCSLPNLLGLQCQT